MLFQDFVQYEYPNSYELLKTAVQLVNRKTIKLKAKDKNKAVGILIAQMVEYDKGFMTYCMVDLINSTEEDHEKMIKIIKKHRKKTETEENPNDLSDKIKLASEYYLPINSGTKHVRDILEQYKIYTLKYR